MPPNLRRALTPVEAAAGFSPEDMAAEQDQLTDTLAAQWVAVLAEQNTALAAQVETAIDAGDVASLAALSAPDAGGGGILAKAMQDAWSVAVARMAAEAATQGITIDPAAVPMDLEWLRAMADARAAMAAQRQATAASARALMLGGSMTGRQAREDVLVVLGGLSPAPLADQLRAAILAASNTARGAALETAPGAAYTASEVLDANCCPPCAAVDGTEFATLEEAQDAYPQGGYIDCDGGPRCRGTYIATWPDISVTAPGDISADDISATAARTGAHAMPNPTPGRSHPFTATGPTGRIATAAGTVTTVDDIRREFYETADYSQWITEVQVGPAGLALIVCDDDSGDLFRVPVLTSPGGVVTFGPAAPVLVEYVPAPPEPPELPGPAFPENTGPGPGQPRPAPGLAPDLAAAYPPGRRIAAAWNTREQSRAGQARRGQRVAFTDAQQEDVIRAAVASGRIPAGKAAHYRAELAAGGKRGGAAIARLLAHFPAGRPLEARSSSRPVAAASAEDAIWSALYGKGQPGPRESDQPRKTAPATLAEYRALYPEPGTAAPADRLPPIPELAGYVGPPAFTAPPDLPPPGQGVAGARPETLPRSADIAAGVQTAGPLAPLAIVEHGEIDGGAWHSHAHAHPGSEANGHDHEHVHQPGAGGLHTPGPGHNHDAPAEYVPEMASRAPGSLERSQHLAARVVAAAAASPSVRVRWPR